MEAWGAAALAMALEAGLVGAWLALAVVALRPRASWRAGLLLLGLLQLLVPPLLTPLPRAVLSVEVGGRAVVADTAASLGALAAVQLAGLAAGGLLLLRSALALRATLRRARRVQAGPIHRALQRAAEAQGIPTPALYLTDGRGPGAAGVLRPAVLIPEALARGLDPDALRMVLAHEVAHIARRDPLAALVRGATVALWWFHPVAWLLARMHRAAAEDACDDAVARRADPDAYCDAILAAATGGRPAPMTAGLGHPLGRRFRRLLRPDPGPRLARLLGPRGAAWLAGAVAATALIAAPLQLLAFDTGPDADPGAAVRHEIVIRHVID